MINSCHLIGRLGKDPELHNTNSGKTVCSFSLATDGYGKDAPPDWHNIVVWGKAAETCHQYLHKGSLVFVGGRIRYETYEKDGVKKYITKIIANRVEFLDPKPNSGGEPNKETVPPDDLPF